MTDPTPAPTAPDWRALCQELRDALDNVFRVMAGEGGTEHISTATAVLLRADTTLATPPAATREAEPLPQAGAQPTSDEIESRFRAWWSDRFGSAYFGAIPLVACIEWTHIALARWGVAAVPAIRRALELWGGAAVPVPVSERLPGAEDLDAKGMCWWAANDGIYDHWRKLDLASALNNPWRPTHWLPHWALPVPAAAAGEVK